MDYIFELFMALIHSIKDWMPTLFNIFTHSEVAIGLAGSMIILGTSIFLYLFFVLYMPTKVKLDQLVDEVNKIKNPEEMAKNFAYVDKIMSDIFLVRHPWTELKKHFVFPQSSTKDPIRSIISPSELFNMDIAEEGGFNIKQYTNIADNFVGIGLVFTFLGLVSGIYFAAQGLGGDVEEAKQGLVLLLSAATFKFMTSIAGVGVAVLFSIGYNRIYCSLQMSLTNLAILLDKRILSVTLETIEFAQYNELKKQNQLLEDLLTKTDARLAKLENNQSEPLHKQNA